MENQKVLFSWLCSIIVYPLIDFCILAVTILVPWLSLVFVDKILLNSTLDSLVPLILLDLVVILFMVG